MKYLITCIAGMQDVVAHHIVSDIPCVKKATYKEDGLVIIETTCEDHYISKLPYINNAYLLLHEQKIDKNEAIEQTLNYIAQFNFWKNAYKNISTIQKNRYFKLVVSENSQLISASKNSLTKLANKIANTSRLNWNSKTNGAEFWIIKRTSGYVFFAVRISKRIKTEKNLQKGELRPELAHLLCLMSEPKASDVFMDPFAGSGAIPFIRANYPYNMIFCFDINEENIIKIKQKIKGAKNSRLSRKSPFITRVEDATSLSKIENNFIDKVVCDPPWGIYDDTVDIAKLYTDTFDELYRVTKSAGIIIVLVSNNDIVKYIIDKYKGKLLLIESINLLVSGKKAAALKFRVI